MTVDEILLAQSSVEKAAVIVNFHGDYSSEKVVIGHYLDGRVSAVIGDHWHVPTADGRILPGGTAHQTDAGMVGILNASLGVDVSVIIDRWRDNKMVPNRLAQTGPLQFNGFIFEVDTNTHLAVTAKSINLTYN